MDEGAFGAHIEELAVKFKDKVAELAAATVLTDAQEVREYIQSCIDAENTNAFNDWQYGENAGNGNPPTPKTVGADHGYEYIVGTYYQELVDDYKNNYEVELLTFDPGSANDAENALKNEHLMWIPELFSRAGSVPQPSRGDDPISTLEGVGGTDSLIEVTQNSDGGLDVGEADANALGASQLGAAVEADVEKVRGAVDSWDSATSKVFKNDFLPRIPIAAAHQVNVVKTLRNLLGVHHGLVRVGRADIDSLAHTALEAAEAYDDCCGGGGDAQVWLGLAGAVLTITGACLSIASAGTSLALVSAGVSLLSGSVNLAKNLDSLQPEATELGGESLNDLVENVRTRADEIWAKLDEGYEALGGGMDSLADLCSGNKVLVAPRPEGPNGEPGFGDANQGNVDDVVE